MGKSSPRSQRVALLEAECPVGKFVCRRCLKFKAISQFVFKEGVRLKACKRCRDAENRQMNRWRREHHEEVRAYERKVWSKYSFRARKKFLKRRYGISIDDYYVMLEAQGGHCATCPTTPQPGRSLAVDHDHRTNRVRGLLCDSCNRALGLVKDDPGILRALENYLANFLCLRAVP